MTTHTLIQHDRFVWSDFPLYTLTAAALLMFLLFLIGVQSVYRPVRLSDGFGADAPLGLTASITPTRGPRDASVRRVSHGAGLAVAAYDPTQPRVIDPTVVYSSYFGGSSDDIARDVATDAEGNLYIVGNTYSSALPGGGGSVSGGSDLFITKLNANGTAVIYTTVLGGSGVEEAAAVAVSDDGSRVWVVGSTTSDDLPTLNAFQSVHGGGVDALIAQLDENGTPVFVSYYGGWLYDAAEDIALDSAGNAHLAGSIWGGFFAKINGQTYQNEYERMIDGEEAIGYAIALDDQDNLYITGKIDSPTWPTVNPVQDSCGAFDDSTCSDDAFVVKLSPAGDELLFSTYLGGSAANGGSGADIGRALAVNANGDIAIAGETFAGDFPTAQAVQSQKPGGSTMSAAFVTRLVKQGAGYGIGFSTYLGGEGTDWATDVALDAAGAVTVGGGTGSRIFPTAAALQAQLGPGVCFSSSSRACYDAFIAHLSAAGDLVFSTYWGGTDDDVATGLDVDGNGSVVVVGRTESVAFPVTDGGFQTNRAGGEEAFVLKLSLTDAPFPPPQGQKVVLPFVRR